MNKYKSNNCIDLIRKFSSPLLPIPTEISASLKKIPNIKGVVFDVYGTLFISAAGDISLAENKNYESILRKVMADFGFKMINQEKHYAHLFNEFIQTAGEAKRRTLNIKFSEIEIREVWTNFIETLLRSGDLAGDIDNNTIENMAVAYECQVNPVWPMPNVEQVLNNLLSQNFLLGIISNAQFYTPLLFESLLNKNLNEWGIGKNRSVWSYKISEAKPSVKLYDDLKKRLSLLGTSASEILYVGNDMRNDILPASIVGFKTALFAGDKRSLRLRKDDADCCTVVPDLIITNLNQLLECV